MNTKLSPLIFLPITDGLGNTSVDKALHQAVVTGDLFRVNELLVKGYNIHTKDEMGHSPLDLAILYGKDDVTRILLNTGHLSDHGARSLALALSVENEPIAKTIVHHSDFSADAVAMRAYIFEQIETLVFIKDQHVELPVTQTVLDMKMLAHRYNLEGDFDIQHNNKPFQVSLEGFYPEFTVPECYRSFKEYVEGLAKSGTVKKDINVYQKALEALAFVNQDTLDAKMLMQRYYEGYSSASPKPIFILSGWDRHAVGIVIDGDKFYKCNRGNGSDREHGVVEYRIENPIGFNEALFDRILKGVGTSDFLLHEINGILGLVEIGRYESTPQEVGNCTWISASEGIRALLIAEFARHTGSAEKAKTLADTVYGDWLKFDLTYGLKELSHDKQTAIHQEVIDDVLLKILETQHDATDKSHVEHAVLILPHLSAPILTLNNLNDAAFQESVNENIKSYIQTFEKSKPWTDYFYFTADSILSTVNLGFSSETYKSYIQKVELGKELKELIEIPAIITPQLNFNTAESVVTLPASKTLKWEEVFQGGGACHSAFTPEKPSYEKYHQPQADAQVLISENPEYALGVI